MTVLLPSAPSLQLPEPSPAQQKEVVYPRMCARWRHHARQSSSPQLTRVQLEPQLPPQHHDTAVASLVSCGESHWLPLTQEALVAPSTRLVEVVYELLVEKATFLYQEKS